MSVHEPHPIVIPKSTSAVLRAHAAQLVAQAASMSATADALEAAPAVDVDAWVALAKLGAEARTPLLRAARLGQLPTAVKVGRSWRARRSAVDAFFASGGAAPKERDLKPANAAPPHTSRDQVLDPVDRALASGKLRATKPTEHVRGSKGGR